MAVDELEQLTEKIADIDSLFYQYREMIVTYEQQLKSTVKMAQWYRQTIMKAVEYTTDPEMKAVLAEAFRPIE